MDAFRAGFMNELVAGFEPFIKQALGDDSDLSKLVGEHAGRFARGTLGSGLLYKIVDPEVTTGEALRTGAAVTGGGMAGSAAARKLKLGALAGGGLSLLGSAAGAKVMRMLEGSKKKKERARERLFDKASSVDVGVINALSRRLGGDTTPPTPHQLITKKRRRA